MSRRQSQPKGIGHGTSRPRTARRRTDLRRRFVSSTALNHRQDRLERNPLAQGLHVDAIEVGLRSLAVGLVGRKDAGRSIRRGPQDYPPWVFQARRTGDELSGFHETVAQVDADAAGAVEPGLSHAHAAIAGTCVDRGGLVRVGRRRQLHWRASHPRQRRALFAVRVGERNAASRSLPANAKPTSPTSG